MRTFTLTIILLLCFSTAGYAGPPIEILTVALEASGEPFLGQVYVARTIITRRRERGQTAEEVCLSPYQFSCHNKGANMLPRTPEELKTAQKAWNHAKTLAVDVNLYCRVDSYPYWRKSPRVEEIAVIGEHVYFFETR